MHPDAPRRHPGYSGDSTERHPGQKQLRIYARILTCWTIFHDLLQGQISRPPIWCESDEGRYHQVCSIAAKWAPRVDAQITPQSKGHLPTP